MVVDSSGTVGYLGLGGWDSHNCLDIYADPATMAFVGIYYVLKSLKSLLQLELLLGSDSM
jgi:hypothetical protein